MEVCHPSSQHPLLEERHAMPIEPGRDHSPRLLFGSFLSKSEEWDGICTFVNISTPNVSVGRSRSGFYFRPTSPGLFWYFFGTSSHLPLSCEKPRKTPRSSPAHAQTPVVISTPNGAVGSLVRFIFVPPLSTVLFRWFFFRPSPTPPV